jgi:hypothetical protein
VVGHIRTRKYSKTRCSSVHHHEGVYSCLIGTARVIQEHSLLVIERRGGARLYWCVEASLACVVAYHHAVRPKDHDGVIYDERVLATVLIRRDRSGSM